MLYVVSIPLIEKCQWTLITFIQLEMNMSSDWFEDARDTHQGRWNSLAYWWLRWKNESHDSFLFLFFNHCRTGGTL
jgi:hypothetical protein